jgi:hypothetical protein
MAGASGASFAGTVVETTNASRYTYVQIDTGKEKIWAAGPKAAVKVGDHVSVVASMPNKNFFSPTLKRTFDELYFVEAITPAGGACPSGTCSGGVSTNGVCPKGVCPSGMPALPPGHPGLKPAGAAASTNAAFEVIQKPDGGKTVAEIWAGKAKLSGKPVVVRAKVVKVSPDIMGMNFLHLRDGTGGEGENDLVVTTKDTVTAQTIVTASGVLTTGKDYGSGYKYDVIMENATVTAK